MAVYFRKGDPSYAYSNDLKGRTSWTPEDVRARRDAGVCAPAGRHRARFPRRRVRLDLLVLPRRRLRRCHC